MNWPHRSEKLTLERYKPIISKKFSSEKVKKLWQFPSTFFPHISLKSIKKQLPQQGFACVVVGLGGGWRDYGIRQTSVKTEPKKMSHQPKLYFAPKKKNRSSSKTHLTKTYGLCFLRWVQWPIGAVCMVLSLGPQPKSLELNWNPHFLGYLLLHVIQ